MNPQDPKDYNLREPQIKNELDSNEEEGQEENNMDNQNNSPPIQDPQKKLNVLQLNFENIKSTNQNPYEIKHPNQDNIVSKFANLNISDQPKGIPNKSKNMNQGLAFNYFFGESNASEQETKDSFSQQSNQGFQPKHFYPQESNEPPQKIPNIDEYNETNFEKEFNKEDNYMLNEGYNKNINPNFQNMENPMSKGNPSPQFNPSVQQPNIPLAFEHNEEVDNQLLRLNYSKGTNIPGKFYVIKSIDEANIMRVRLNYL